MSIIYKLINVSKKYKSANGCYALKNINLTFPNKGFYSIVGLSGSGKTTILNLLGGIDKPTSGDLYFNGYNFSKMSNRNFDKVRNEYISFVFQDYNLISDFTVYENIALGMQFKRIKKSVIDEKINKILDDFNLKGFENRKIRTLSGGQQQRVAIARALTRDSKVLLCDEPTANLDGALSKDVFELLKKISKEKLVILVSHNVELAKEYSDQVIELENGHIKEKSSILEENFEEPNNKLTSAHLSFKNFIKTLFSNFKRTKIVTILSLIIMSVLLALFASILSLKNYSHKNAYAQSFENNYQYIVPITKYGESNRQRKDPYTNEYYYVGPQILTEDVSETDYIDLINNVKNSGSIYKSFYYNVSLSNFSQNLTRVEENNYYSTGFKTIIPLNNVETLNQPLVKGRYPSEGNEIVIYDYMEESMSRLNLFNGDIIGQTIEDYVNNYSFKVVGVLKSNYLHYSYLNTRDLLYGDKYAQSYLNELECIFCLESFYKSLPKTHIVNTRDIYGFLDNEKETIDEYHFDTNLEYAFYDVKNQNLTNYDFIYDDLEPNSYGMIISKKLAMKIAGIDDVSTFDNSSFGSDYFGSEAFADKFKIAYSYEFYSDSIDPSFYTEEYVDILGVTNNLEDEEYYLVNEIPLAYNNFSFRGFLVSLTNNANKNKNIISNFLWPDRKDDSYYSSIKDDEVIYGYTFYDPLSAILTEAKDYVPSVSNTAKNIAIYVTILAVLVIFYFTYSGIRNNYYKIGLFKSMGLSNANITLMYGSQALVTTFISMILSIPLSIILVNMINKDFVSDISTVLKIFNLEPIGTLYSILIGFGVLIIGIIYPLIRLYIQTPVEMIRGEK